MAESFKLPTAMWRIQFELLGGLNRMIAVSSISAAGLAIAIISIRRYIPKMPFSSFAGNALDVLIVAQILAALIGGCSAVHRALLRDYQTKMIESHRLTPMSGGTVVLGYVFGATLQVWYLLAVVFVTGVILSIKGGLPVGAWFVANLLLVNGAVTLWTAMVLIGLKPGKPTGPAPLMFLIGSTASVTLAIPVAACMAGIYVPILVFTMVTGAAPVTGGMTGAVAATSLAYTALWLAAASEKYRRPDLPAINGIRGLMLVALALAIGVVGLTLFPNLAISSGSSAIGNLPEFQWIATFAFGLVMATFVLAGTVKCNMLALRGTALRDWSDRIPSLTVAIGLATLICLVLVTVGKSAWVDLLPHAKDKPPSSSAMISVWAWSVSAATLALLTARSVFQIAFGVIRSPRFVIAVFLILCWAAPCVVDYFRGEFVRDQGDPMAFSMLLGFSPIGTLVGVWSALGIPLWPGMSTQIVLAAVLAILAHRGLALRRRSTKLGGSCNADGERVSSAVSGDTAAGADTSPT